MKRMIALLFVLAIALPAAADSVSLTKATEAASSFFNGGERTRGGIEPQLVWMGSQMTRSPYAAPFYVFNNPQGGWIMIAGEDSGNAVLGWSDKGSFDPNDLPANAAAWFEEYANQINWARAHFVSQSEASAREWSDLLEGRIRLSTVKNLGTATWGQGSPYNQNCPRIDGSSVSYSTGTLTITGCVATATAIVMRYFQHPAQGSGSVGGYAPYVKAVVSPADSIAPVIDLDADTEGYDWANMPLSKPSTTVQKNATAKLMFHVALAVEMLFGTESSSSYLRKIQNALVNHFDYDPSMRIVNRQALNTSEWLALFKGELDADRPVLISGRKEDGTGGHLFTAEGYDTEDNIKINWGWNASRNGFFALSYFKTTAEDASGSDYRYSQNILVGIKPNEGGTASISLDLYDPGIYLVSEPNLASPSTDFNVYLRVINRAGIAAPCTLRVYVADYTGAQQAISSVEKKTRASLAANNYISYSSWACNLRNRTAPLLGDKLIACYKDESDNYHPLLARGDNFNNNIPIYDIPFIAVRDGGVYSVGEYFDFEIVNTRTTRGDMTVVWSLDGEPVETEPSTSQTSLKLTAAGDHVVKAVVTIAGETQTLVQEIRVE